VEVNDLLRSLDASRKAADAFRLPQETIEKLKPWTEQVRRIQEAMRPMVEAQAQAMRPRPPIVLSVSAPVQTLRVVEAMLVELQAGAERERAGAERQRRMFWLAVISVGVAVVSTAANVLPALLG
jgi:hypothetical protein